MLSFGCALKSNRALFSSPPVSSAPPPLPGWAAAAEPLTVYLCESQQIAICLCWFITPFHRLLNHSESQNITPCFSSSVSLSASFPPLPSHLFSSVVEEGRTSCYHGYALCQPSVENARNQHLNSLACDCLRFWFSRNQVCVVRHVKFVRFYSTLTREKSTQRAKTFTEAKQCPSTGQTTCSYLYFLPDRGISLYF